jgi:hypothetical protein
LTQMFADMGGARPIGTGGGWRCVHNEKASMRISRLPLPRT